MPDPKQTHNAGCIPLLLPDPPPHFPQQKEAVGWPSKKTKQNTSTIHQALQQIALLLKHNVYGDCSAGNNDKIDIYSLHKHFVRYLYRQRGAM